VHEKKEVSDGHPVGQWKRKNTYFLSLNFHSLIHEKHSEKLAV
jgi:hypothetical protein